MASLVVYPTPAREKSVSAGFVVDKLEILVLVLTLAANSVGTSSPKAILSRGQTTAVGVSQPEKEGNHQFEHEPFEDQVPFCGTFETQAGGPVLEGIQIG